MERHYWWGTKTRYDNVNNTLIYLTFNLLNWLIYLNHLGIKLWNLYIQLKQNVYFVFIDLEKTGKYDGTLLRELLRAIRNKVSTMHIILIMYTYLSLRHIIVMNYQKLLKQRFILQRAWRHISLVNFHIFSFIHTKWWRQNQPLRNVILTSLRHDF